MIGKVNRGDRMRGLLCYLFGEGRRDEHENQHVIATSTGIEVDHGRALSDSEMHRLATQLDTPRAIFGTDVDGGYVWHLSLSNRSDDRELSDDEWADAVRETMSELGFDDPVKAPAPWVAVRHGRSQGGHDHVHVAVSLVREDGTKASIHNDYVKVGQACRRLEQRYALTVVGGRDAGATPWPKQGEYEAAQADQTRPTLTCGRRQTDREELAIVVRAAAEASVDEVEFVRRLRTQGYQVWARPDGKNPESIAGYAVAIDKPGSRRHSGYYLAKDLSLPKLRARCWEPIDNQREAWIDAGAGVRTNDADVATLSEPADGPGREAAEASPSQMREAAAEIRREIDDVPAALARGDMTTGDAAAAAAAALSATACVLEPFDPGPLTDAAAVMARSAQVEVGRAGRSRALAMAAFTIMQPIRGRSAGALFLEIVIDLHRLLDAVERRHAAQEQLGRALEVRRQADALGAAIEATQHGHGPWPIAPARGSESSIEPVAHSPRRDAEVER